MFSFSSVYKKGSRLEKTGFSFRLEQALGELFEVYDQLGGRTAGAGAALEGRLESCLGEPGNSTGPVRSRFHTLLRARDIHRFIQEPPQTAALRMKVLEQVLFHRTPAERWSAARDLLLPALDGLCGTGVRGWVAGLENFKQQVSQPTGPLGSLLVALALFNFDSDEEKPPPNLTIRFARGRFPEHRWEFVDPAGSVAISGESGPWRAANPFCRWEYLAADLSHAVFRMANFSAPAAGGEKGWRRNESLRWFQRPREKAAEQLYCSFDSASPSTPGEQLELFPLRPETFLPELQRRIHRRFHAEGVRTLALVMDHLAASGEGEVVFLDLADLATQAGGDMTRAKCRARAKKTWAVLKFLSEVTCTRIATRAGRSTAQNSRFVTILDILSESGPRARDAEKHHQPLLMEQMPNPEGTQVRLVVDPMFHGSDGRNLGAPYTDLPQGLVEADPKEHPFALALYVFLRGAWRSQGGQQPAAVRRTARQIFEEAGLWVSESSRYRSLEGLKRELDFLRERGWLAKWRMYSGATRDAMDDTFRMEAPHEGPAKKTDSGTFARTASLVSA